MPLLLLIRLILVRALVVVIAVAALYIGIAAIDYFLGTNAIAVIWQWLARLWQLVLRWLQFAGRLLLRGMPGFLKRFIFRKGMSGIWNLLTTGALALLFASLGGEKYDAVLKRVEAQKTQTVASLLRLWNLEIWFMPRWLRAGIFVAAVTLCIMGFVEIQEWAENRNSPTFLGIDPWSFLFGFVASFFLTKLPVIGFDHFVSVIFQPMQHRYRHLIRGKGPLIVILNWLLALRPIRRKAELERKRFMRRWKQKHGNKSYAEVRRERQKKQRAA
ncbi:MAG: hypothetical protein ACR2OX_04190 [Methyloligellaceae bacterium]